MKVNPAALAPNGSRDVPGFVQRGTYVDVPFVCVGCGKAEVWRAAQQRWWYEVAKGGVFTTASRCRACRRVERERRTGAPGARPDLLRIRSAELRALREAPPTPAGIAKAIEALGEKHEGLRTLAASVLGAWGRPEFVAPLRAVLVELRDRSGSGGLRQAVILALERTAGEADAGWVLEEVFDHPFSAGSRAAASLLGKLPWESWIGRVRLECGHAIWARRRLAATVLWSSTAPAPVQIPLLNQLLTDTDREVRAMARLQLARLQEGTPDSSSKAGRRSG